MYQGKHVSEPEPRKPRRLRWFKGLVVLCAAVVLLLGVVSGTLAYLTTKTPDVKNTFTPATSGIDIPEGFDKETKKNVKVKNESDYPVYARATYVAYWVSDADNSVLPGEPTLTPTMGGDWTYRAADGYWYYNKVLPAEEESTDFIVSMTADKIEGRHLVVDVIMETVQAEPEQAVKDVWDFVPGSGN